MFELLSMILFRIPSSWSKKRNRCGIIQTFSLFCENSCSRAGNVALLQTYNYLRIDTVWSINKTLPYLALLLQIPVFRTWSIYFLNSFPMSLMQLAVLAILVLQAWFRPIDAFLVGINHVFMRTTWSGAHLRLERSLKMPSLITRRPKHLLNSGKTISLESALSLRNLHISRELWTWIWQVDCIRCNWWASLISQ